MNNFSQKIDELVSAGWKVNGADSYTAWSSRVTALLTAAIDAQAAEAFKDLGGTNQYANWERYRDRQVGHLEGLALRIEASGLQQAKVEHVHVATSGQTPQATNRVFLVHGLTPARKKLRRALLSGWDSPRSFFTNRPTKAEQLLKSLRRTLMLDLPSF